MSTFFGPAILNTNLEKTNLLQASVLPFMNRNETIYRLYLPREELNTGLNDNITLYHTMH